MEIKKVALAGTLESSDVQVTVEPSDKGVNLSLESSVMNQYGQQIKETVLETLDRLGVKNIKIYYSYGETKEKTKEIVELIFENSEIEIIDID